VLFDYLPVNSAQGEAEDRGLGKGRKLRGDNAPALHSEELEVYPLASHPETRRRCRALPWCRDALLVDGQAVASSLSDLERLSEGIGVRVRIFMSLRSLCEHK